MKPCTFSHCLSEFVSKRSMRNSGSGCVGWLQAVPLKPVSHLHVPSRCNAGKRSKDQKADTEGEETIKLGEQQQQKQNGKK